MNRDEMHIDNEEIIAYGHRAHKKQIGKHNSMIQKGEITPYLAYLNYIIIEQVIEVATILQERNISWNDFRKMLDKLPVQTKGTQSKLEL